jgi:hypothetical protein
VERLFQIRLWHRSPHGVNLAGSGLRRIVALTRGITELFLAFKLHRLKKELAPA